MIRGLFILLLAAALVRGATAESPIDESKAADGVRILRLRPNVTIRSDRIRLSDVLTVERADALVSGRLEAAILAEELIGPIAREFSHDQVVAELASAGLNLAQVSVVGALSCRVQVMPELVEQPETDEPAADDAAPLLKPKASRAVERTSLESRVRELIGSELSEKGQVEVVFEAAAEEFLSLASPFEFVIRPVRGAQVGPREFNVTIRRDGRTQRTIRIGAQVKLLRQVAVAARPLNAGAYIKRESLTTALREFSTDADMGFVGLDGLVGQQAARFIAVGEVVEKGAVRSVDLVKRSQPVVVEGGEGVRLRLTGVALDSGKLGDSVRIRLGDSRKNRRELRGVVTSVGVVRLTEEPA